MCDRRKKKEELKQPHAGGVAVNQIIMRHRRYALAGLCVAMVLYSQWNLLEQDCRQESLNDDTMCSDDQKPHCVGTLRPKKKQVSSTSLDPMYNAAFQESPDVLKMFQRRCNWYWRNKGRCGHAEIPLTLLQSLCLESKLSLPTASKHNNKNNSDTASRAIIMRNYDSKEPSVIHGAKQNNINQSASEAKNNKKNKRIAILVAGSLRRYFFESDMKHLIEPLSKQGYQVDYYLLLTTSNPPAFRAGSGYMEHIASDPLFYNDPARESTLLNDPNVRATVSDAVQKHGGTLRSCLLRDHVDIDAALEGRRKITRALFPNQDADSRFPMFDVRPAALTRTANGNRNMMRLFLGLQLLWDAMRGVEEDEMKEKYDHVIMLRDDALWLHDFDMDRLIREDPTADAYILSCNARDPLMVAQEINDHGMVLKRSKAEPFGRYLDTLLQDTDIEACQKSMSASITKGGARGCNSEMLLKWNIEYHNLKVKLVGQDLIPFQRAAHVRFENGTIVECYHKYCQSAEDPLTPKEGVERCKALPFSSDNE